MIVFENNEFQETTDFRKFVPLRAQDEDRKDDSSEDADVETEEESEEDVEVTEEENITEDSSEKKES